MRIVGGTARGRTLVGPKGTEIRPTSDKVRESLFNVLGQTLEPIAVLDLFAGTGALALEALSRGAASAVLVDSAHEAAGLCRTNAQELGFESQVEIWPVPVQRALQRLGREARQFPLVFADPPYALLAGGGLLEQVVQLLPKNGLLVLEHDKREELPEATPSLVREDERAYGDTRVSLYRKRAVD
jgi:16S rRNA (guanine(966)-N(2))-methyltransferase RsmD